MKRLTFFIFASTFVFIGATPAFPALLYQDSFNDNSISTASGANELIWTVATGNITLLNTAGNIRLGINRGTTTVVAAQRIQHNEYTLLFNASITWSERGRVIVLYVDPDNYYSIGLGAKSGVFRRHNGIETQIMKDDEGFRLPHARDANGDFKIYVRNDGRSITIQADRAGDGLDYDVRLTDDAEGNAAKFVNTTVGFMVDGGSPAAPWFSVDDVRIEDALVSDTRSPVIYYVNAGTGEDGRTPQQAQSPGTPWKTIQRAADHSFSGDTIIVMPGTYRESVAPKSNGAEDLPITFKAMDPARRPLLEGSEMISLDNWTQTTLVDFTGVSRLVYKSAIDWVPTAVFHGDRQMFLSQEPNQTNADDPYNHAEFRVLPHESNKATSHTDLIDPTFLIQSDPHFWDGGSVFLYDTYGNFVEEKSITGFIPAEHKLIVSPFDALIGSDNPSRPDRYAIVKHRRVLDKEGEFFIDTSVTPHEIYVWPYAGMNLNAITASKYMSGFNLTNKRGITVDGFAIRFFNGNGINVDRARHIFIKNSEIHHNRGSGVGVNSSEHVTLDTCKLHSNFANGASFGYGSYYSVLNSEITENFDNGIWVGTGGGTVFNAHHIIVRGNFIHRQGGGRRHPDNYQMHQVEDVLMENNVFIQLGHQNMWTQYSDNFVIRNNIFVGGPLGINSTIRSEITHNMFYLAGIRYDAHLTNHPERGDFYKPQSARLQNNIFVESSPVWPDRSVIPDLKSVFTIDHNYYNIESSWLRSGWADRGPGYGAGSTLETKRSLLTNIIRKIPDESYTSFDFHLVDSTACVDAGIDVGLKNDLENYVRPFGEGPDIGPYEFGSYPLVPETQSDAPGRPAFLKFKNMINPARGEIMHILVDVPAPASIRLTIYGRNGEEITRLLDGAVPTGLQTVNWDGRNRAGETIASGVYIAVLESDGRQEKKKVVVLK